MKSEDTFRPLSYQFLTILNKPSPKLDLQLNVKNILLNYILRFLFLLLGLIKLTEIRKLYLTFDQDIRNWTINLGHNFFPQNDWGKKGVQSPAVTETEV